MKKGMSRMEPEGVQVSIRQGGERRFLFGPELVMEPYAVEIVGCSENV